MLFGSDDAAKQSIILRPHPEEPRSGVSKGDRRENDPDLLKPSLLLSCVSPAWWLLRSDQTRSHPELGRQTLSRQWYYVSRPGRVGRRQACKAQENPLIITHRPGNAAPRFGQDDAKKQARRPSQDGRRSRLNKTIDAGWSSPVARQAHNLKAAGSNPASATTFYLYSLTVPI